MSASELLQKTIQSLPETYCQNHFDMSVLQDPGLAVIKEKLTDPGAWCGMQINYEKPYLNRIFFSVPKKDKKVFFSLHYFFDDSGALDDAFQDFENPYNIIATSDDDSESLYHPHPWAATFRILDGSYEQFVSQAGALGLGHPPLRENIHRHDALNSKNCAYSFNSPLMWHEVIPTKGASVSTMMISYRPDQWDQQGPTPPEKQRSLDKYEIEAMCQHFKPLIDRALSGIKPEIYRFD